RPGLNSQLVRNLSKQTCQEVCLVRAGQVCWPGGPGAESVSDLPDRGGRRARGGSRRGAGPCRGAGSCRDAAPVLSRSACSQVGGEVRGPYLAVLVDQAIAPHERSLLDIHLDPPAGSQLQQRLPELLFPHEVFELLVVRR